MATGAIVERMVVGGTRLGTSATGGAGIRLADAGAGGAGINGTAPGRFRKEQGTDEVRFN